MSVKTGVLYLGDSFAEIGKVEFGKLIETKTWYRGREPLSKVFSQFFNDPISELLVCNKSLHSIYRKRLGNRFAFLVTSGFENWLDINRPVVGAPLSLDAERAPSILEPEFVFGVQARMDRQGGILQDLNINDLEFLVSKLKMHQIKDVAIGLLHANVNSEHENKIAEFLRSQDFRVHLSSQMQGISETSRWWAAVLNAYLTPIHLEQFQELQQALQLTTSPQTEIYLLGGDKKVSYNHPLAPIQSFFGPIMALEMWRKKWNASALLYLGVEDFWLLPSVRQHRCCITMELGPVAIPNFTHTRLSIQNTQRIQKSFWGNLEISQNEMGFEPGPICLGKGLAPQLLDIFWLKGRLDEVPGLSDRLVERFKPRVLESLQTQSRNFIQGSHRFEDKNPMDIIDELEQEFVKKLMVDLIDLNSSVVVIGALAFNLQKLIQPKCNALSIQTKWSDSPSVLLQAMALCNEWTMENQPSHFLTH